jgi:hypothetical protein
MNKTLFFRKRSTVEKILLLISLMLFFTSNKFWPSFLAGCIFNLINCCRLFEKNPTPKAFGNSGSHSVLLEDTSRIWCFISSSNLTISSNNFLSSSSKFHCSISLLSWQMTSRSDCIKRNLWYSDQNKISRDKRKPRLHNSVFSECGMSFETMELRTSCSQHLYCSLF